MRTITISTKDLAALLAENNRLHDQVRELQERGTELVLEIRSLKEVPCGSS